MPGSRPDLIAACREPSTFVRVRPGTFMLTTEELQAVVGDAIEAERARCVAIVDAEAINPIDRQVLRTLMENPR